MDRKECPARAAKARCRFGFAGSRSWAEKLREWGARASPRRCRGGHSGAAWNGPDAGGWREEPRTGPPRSGATAGLAGEVPLQSPGPQRSAPLVKGWPGAAQMELDGLSYSLPPRICHTSFQPGLNGALVTTMYFPFSRQGMSRTGGHVTSLFICRAGSAIPVPTMRN